MLGTLEGGKRRQCFGVAVTFGDFQLPNYQQLIKSKEIICIICNQTMEPQKSLMVDQRTQFLQKWLTSASSHESRDDASFLSGLIHLIEHDNKTCQIFNNNLVGLLQSHQSNIDQIFQYCVGEKNQKFCLQICQFLEICFNEKNQVALSVNMESYLVHHIWRKQMDAYVSSCRINSAKIIEYICLKMRSLDSFIRFQAVCSLFQIIQFLERQRDNNVSLLTAVREILPQMIEKENYGKQIGFSRGVLLQILEDQFCHIKKKGIQLLGRAQSYLDPTMIRPLILYMLNDEHQAVREMCLIVLSQIPSLDIEKQDLSALMVCLKQNNTLMRSYTYENLPHINITSAQDFNLIMQRLYSILLNRSEDKKKIYIVCSKLGRKYPNYVIGNLDKIYKYSDSEQPNWKSLVYRARFITVASIGTERWPKCLPKYFNNHYLYIRDVLLYVFEQNISDAKLLDDLNEDITQEECMSNEVSINLETDWQLYHYIVATEAITQGFLKSAFALILDWVRSTRLGKYSNTQIQGKIIAQVQKLEVIYNFYDMPVAIQFVQNFIRCVLSNQFSELRPLMHIIQQQNTWKYLEKVEKIIFKVSNADKTKIVISNIPQILKRSFIEFSNSTLPQNTSSNLSSQNSSQVGYLRMSQVDFQEVNDKMCYFRMSIKCRQIKCFILYGHPPQQHITQAATLSFADSSWLTDLVQ